MNPAKEIVDKLGGPTKVAHALGVHRTAIYYWTRSQRRGGTGGVIPHWHREALIRHAKTQGIRLRPEDFAVRLEQ